MPAPEQLKQSWIDNASAWCDAVREERIESRRVVTDRAIVNAVLEHSPRTVLDLGCGEGWLARSLAERGIAVTGIDGSPALIAAANESGGGKFVQASYAELAAGSTEVDGPFDAVVANFSLLEETIAEILTAVRPRLAPDGVFIVQTVHPAFVAGDGGYADGWRVETFQGFPGQWPQPMPWYFRTIESWVRELRAAGLSIRDIREPLHPTRGVPASILFVCG